MRWRHFFLSPSLHPSLTPSVSVPMARWRHPGGAQPMALTPTLLALPWSRGPANITTSAQSMDRRGRGVGVEKEKKKKTLARHGTPFVHLASLASPQMESCGSFSDRSDETICTPFLCETARGCPAYVIENINNKYDPLWRFHIPGGNQRRCHRAVMGRVCMLQHRCTRRPWQISICVYEMEIDLFWGL